MNVQKEYANRKIAKRSIESYKKEKNVFDAAETGDLETVTELCEDSLAEVFKTEEIGYFTALHLAAKNGHLEVAKYLLGKGADINRKTKSGETPLHLAAMFGQAIMVRFLLVQGANYNLTNFHKQGPYTVRHTPREVAEDYKFPEIVKIFDQFLVWEKKRDKEAKELENLQLQLTQEYDQLLLQQNEQLLSSNNGIDLIELKAVHERNQAEMKIQHERAMVEFFKTHKTQKPPSPISPVTSEATDTPPPTNTTDQ
eukprot:TRINITY_DN14545_c0_g2_i5.p1 TRINITY_DN14545_c0_g2~~TRINITY_DN14545_c0_g2_i5.p1  ORF type:complete len:255 (-),score=62.33 TRINITY_DN14545_c0_g2_i5:95-859(-)